MTTDPELTYMAQCVHSLDGDCLAHDYYFCGFKWETVAVVVNSAANLGDGQSLIVEPPSSVVYVQTTCDRIDQPANLNYSFITLDSERVAPYAISMLTKYDYVSVVCRQSDWNIVMDIENMRGGYRWGQNISLEIV